MTLPGRDDRLGANEVASAPGQEYGRSTGYLVPRRIAVKRSSSVVLATVAFALGLTGPASAADPAASCQGLAASSLAGQPGAFAAERRDAFDEAASLGITPGALTSEFARARPGTLEACFG